MVNGPDSGNTDIQCNQVCKMRISIIIQIMNVYECNGTSIFMR